MHDLHDIAQINAGRVMSRSELFDAGVSRRGAESLVRGGVLSELRHGIYRFSPTGREFPEAAHQARITAYLRDHHRTAPCLPLAGPSAQVRQGLPWVGPTPTRVHVVGLQRGMDINRTIQPIGLVPDWQLTMKDGVAMTTPARSVLDTARLHSAEAALAGADYALRNGLTTPEELGEVSRSLMRKRYAYRARTIALLANGKAENAGESVSLLRMYQAHISPPEQQVEITLPDGTQARLDFWWEDAAEAGEFDGRAKYDRYLREGETSGDVLMREKRREDAIRALGVGVTRWGWNDVRDPMREWIPRLRARVGSRSWHF